MWQSLRKDIRILFMKQLRNHSVLMTFKWPKPPFLHISDFEQRPLSQWFVLQTRSSSQIVACIWMNIYSSQQTDHGSTMFICRRHSERDQCYYEFLSRLWLFIIDKLESWLFWLRVFGELQSFRFWLLLSFRFSAIVLSVTNKQTKILRESSALRAAPTRVAIRDRQRYSAKAQRCAPREECVLNISPLTSV